MRVTEKGQVTIPKELRDALGIGAGTEVEFEVERSDDTIVERPVARHRAPDGSRQIQDTGRPMAPKLGSSRVVHTLLARGRSRLDGVRLEAGRWPTGS